MHSDDDHAPPKKMDDPPSSSPRFDTATINASTQKVQTWLAIVENATAMLETAAAELNGEEVITLDDEDEEIQAATRKLDAAFLAVQSAIQAMKDKALSRLTPKDMETLNVNVVTTTLPIGNLRGALTEELAAAGSLDTYRIAVKGLREPLLRELFKWARSLNFHPEESARVVINPVIGIVLDLASHIKLIIFDLTINSGGMYMFTEAAITRSKKKFEAFDAMTKNLLGLGGRADYMTMAVKLDRHFSDYPALQEYIRSVDAISVDRSAFWEQKTLQDSCVTVYEAKKLQKDSSNLIDALPQAIGESLAM
ncbi:hypothetical protein FRB90_012855 [Tulasnella sp. 427]|nr:hypothetical protein FRB90_012855 [Tulasnella sp. 427]